MALGAEPRDIVRMVVGRTARVSVAGVVLGFALARFAMRGLATLLFEVEPNDDVLDGGRRDSDRVDGCELPPARRAARIESAHHHAPSSRANVCPAPQLGRPDLVGRTCLERDMSTPNLQLPMDARPIA